MGDIGFGRGYRAQEELEGHRQQEPVGRFRRWLLENDHCTEAKLEDIENQVEAEMQEAVDFVKQSPVPDVREVMEHVYG
jgi:pyruvate dehydrogenase E1 component alpha subunit